MEAEPDRCSCKPAGCVPGSSLLQALADSDRKGERTVPVQCLADSGTGNVFRRSKGNVTEPVWKGRDMLTVLAVGTCGCWVLARLGSLKIFQVAKEKTCGLVELSPGSTKFGPAQGSSLLHCQWLSSKRGGSVSSALRVSSRRTLGSCTASCRPIGQSASPSATPSTSEKSGPVRWGFARKLQET